MITLSLVLIAVLVLAVLLRKKLKGIGALLLGAALAYGSLATPIGAPLQRAAASVFNGVQSGSNGVINSVK